MGSSGSADSTLGRRLAVIVLANAMALPIFYALGGLKGSALLGNVALTRSLEAESEATSEHIAAKVFASVVVILVGNGEQLSGVGSGVIVRPDGVLLTAYHLVKSAKAAQVRLKNGETYDKAEIIAADERRDVAALRIPAAGLPTLPVARAEEAKQGEAVWVVSNPEGLSWTVSAGVLSASRLADEVPGAGSGYRLLQFTAPVSPGSSGGALVDAQGRILGIVVASRPGQNLNFAVPVESVLGLADGAGRSTLETGSNLNLPQQEKPAQITNPAKANPVEIARSVKTFCIVGNGEFPAEPLEKKLFEKEDFKTGRRLIVKDRRSADVVILLERKPFTWDFTYQMIHQASGVILGSGKVIAWDGVRAAPGIADQIVGRMKYLDAPPKPKMRKG